MEQLASIHLSRLKTFPPAEKLALVSPFTIRVQRIKFCVGFLAANLLNKACVLPFSGEKINRNFRKLEFSGTTKSEDNHLGTKSHLDM